MTPLLLKLPPFVNLPIYYPVAFTELIKIHEKYLNEYIKMFSNISAMMHAFLIENM